MWRSIADQFSTVGFENDYISVARVPCDALARHPWSLGGGGANELKELLEERAEKRLDDVVEDVGFASFTGLDDAFILPQHAARTLGIEDEVGRPMVIGECIRDWGVSPADTAIAPYAKTDHVPLQYAARSNWGRLLWRCRAVANNVTGFGGRTREEDGQNWWEWYRWQKERYESPLRISFAFVATHNHFVLDRGGKAFSRSAPIIKLPEGATEDDHFALLAYLNSSTACFWMKQVFMNKGGSGVGRGIQDEAWEGRFEFDGTKLRLLPIFGSMRLTDLGRRLDQLAQERRDHGAAGVLAEEAFESVEELSRKLADAYDRDERAFHEMVALQEEIDGCVYVAAGLVVDAMPALSASLEPGARMFEHQLATTHPTTQWFARNEYAHPRDQGELPRELRDRWALITEQRTARSRSSSSLTTNGDGRYRIGTPRRTTPVAIG